MYWPTSMAYANIATLFETTYAVTKQQGGCY